MYKNSKAAQSHAQLIRRDKAAQALTKVSTQTTGRCYGYARVSTDQQATEGESLDVQQRVIAGYALQLGLTVEQVFVEKGVSGSKPLAQRPQGAALIAALKPGDTVITPKLDRIFHISLHMIDLGGDVTGNGVSKLVFTILSAVAEAERDRTRTHRGGQARPEEPRPVFGRRRALRFQGGRGWHLCSRRGPANRLGRGAPGKLMLTVMASIAEFEADVAGAQIGLLQGTRLGRLSRTTLGYGPSMPRSR